MLRCQKIGNHHTRLIESTSTMLCLHGELLITGLERSPAESVAQHVALTNKLRETLIGGCSNCHFAPYFRIQITRPDLVCIGNTVNNLSDSIQIIGAECGMSGGKNENIPYLLFYENMQFQRK